MTKRGKILKSDKRRKNTKKLQKKWKNIKNEKILKMKNNEKKMSKKKKNTKNWRKFYNVYIFEPPGKAVFSPLCLAFS